MNDIQLTIDGQSLNCTEGTTILVAAAKAGIQIPFLCWQPGKNTQSNCGLCVVEVEGSDRLVPACSTPAADRMVILTDTEDIQDMRRNVIEIMFGDDVHDCDNCHRNGSCNLQTFLKRYQLSRPSVEEIFTALGL